MAEFWLSQEATDYSNAIRSIADIILSAEHKWERPVFYILREDAEQVLPMLAALQMFAANLPLHCLIAAAILPPAALRAKR